jgi:hypothetical protein
MTTSTHRARTRSSRPAQSGSIHTHRSLDEIGPTLRAGAVANRMGISVTMVEQLRLSQRILAVPQPHGFAYPSWQFEGRGVLSGLMSVLGALDAADSWAHLDFLTTPNPHLANQRPIDTLRNGEVEAVLAVARRSGTRN